MDDARKKLLRAGVYLGDINLALASLSKDIPAYARGIDGDALISDLERSSKIDEEIDRWISLEKTDSLDDRLLRLILDRAISNGRFLSAIRCLEILGERDSHIDKLVKQGLRAVSDGDLRTAAHLFVVASNLSLTEGTPLFQYSGFALHQRCISDPENCVTSRPLDSAVAIGLDYLLGSRKIFEQVNQIDNLEVKSKLLVAIARERDPNGIKFIEAYRRSHKMIEDLSSGLAVVLEKLLAISSTANRLVQSLESLRHGGDLASSKLRRVVSGLARDFEQIEDLGKGWQFSRIRDRLTRLLESANEVSGISEDERLKDLVGEIINSAEMVREQNLIDEIERIEGGLKDSQNLMLGRAVHSDEHWQFLREIGFKYPVAPLMCCVRRFNRRWLVVPRWQSPIATLLREQLESVSQTQA